MHLSPTMLKVAVAVGLLITAHGLSDDFDPANVGFFQAVNALSPTPAPTAATCSDLSGCQPTDFQYTFTYLYNFAPAVPTEFLGFGCSSPSDLGYEPFNGFAALAGTCAPNSGTGFPQNLPQCQADECGNNVVVNICCPSDTPCISVDFVDTPHNSGTIFTATNPPDPLTALTNEAFCGSGPGNTLNCVGNPFDITDIVICPASEVPPPTMMPTPLPTMPTTSI